MPTNSVYGNITNEFITFKYFYLVVVPTVKHQHGVILFYLKKKRESLM